MEYYSALERREILTCATTWMNLEDTMLSEISQSQKDKYCRVVKFIETEIRRVLARVCGGRNNGESSFKRYRVLVWEDEKVLEMDGGDGCTTK